MRAKGKPEERLFDWQPTCEQNSSRSEIKRKSLQVSEEVS